jgi:uncharacterized membrane protein YoaK (UPF0700 family)/membrane-associated phospholipid phosphatase
MQPELEPPHYSRSDSLSLGVLLALAGGFLDAYTYVSRHGVFANSQTGNLVLFGVYLVRGDHRRAFQHLPAILAFVVGVVAAETLKLPAVVRFVRWPARAALVLEMLVLLLIGALPASASDGIVTVLIAFVASLQVSTFRTLLHWSWNSTNSTGNLRSAARGAYLALIERDPQAAIQGRAFGAVIAAFTCGAVLGCLLTLHFGTRAVWAVVVVLAIGLWMFIADHVGSAAQEHTAAVLAWVAPAALGGATLAAERFEADPLAALPPSAATEPAASDGAGTTLPPPVERRLARASLSAALGSLAIAGFLFLTRELRRGVLDDFDQTLLRGVVSLRVPSWNAAALDLTALGSPLVLSIVGAIAALFLGFARDRRGLLQLTLAAVGGGLGSTVLKQALERERPSLSLRLVEVSSWSYPSGHSLASACIYLTLASLLAQRLPRPSQRAAANTVALIVSLCIGCSRAYLGVHYPSDIAAGFLLGSGWALLVGAAVAYAHARLRESQRRR